MIYAPLGLPPGLDGSRDFSNISVKFSPLYGYALEETFGWNGVVQPRHPAEWWKNPNGIREELQQRPQPA